MSFNYESLVNRGESRLREEFRESYNYQSAAEELILENNRNVSSKDKIAGLDQYHIFLSHSSKDAKLILGLVEEFSKFGYRTYVDWIDDPQLDRNSITKETSNRLRQRMNQSKSLLYAASFNAINSKWMPWELGYMDAKKNKAAILPIFSSDRKSSHAFNGQEYLGIYPYCIKETYADYPNNETMWIMDESNTYCTFDEWLKGMKPVKR